MINVSFPDGSKREYPDGSTPLSIAEAISKSLAKRSVIARVNGELRDLKRPLEGRCWRASRSSTSSHAISARSQVAEEALALAALRALRQVGLRRGRGMRRRRGWHSDWADGQRSLWGC